MIHDIENIKIGRNRLIDGRLVYRRGEDSFLVEGENYGLEGLIKLFDIKKHKPEVVVLASAEAHQARMAVALVEPPSRVLSYHLCDNDLDLTCYKLAAIARKVLVYYTSTHVKDGKYYADQPWMIDWETVPGYSKEFLKSAGDKYKDIEIKCPFCDTKHNKLSLYVSHVISNHSYVKDKKPVKEYKPEISDNNAESENKKLEDDYPCPHCDKVLKSASGRTNHIKSTHPGKQ